MTTKEKRATLVLTAMGWTEAELSTLRSAAMQTWQEIGSDAIQATQECDGRSYLKRDEVLELVIDANRLESTLKRNRKPELEVKLRAVLETTRGYETICAALDSVFGVREG